MAGEMELRRKQPIGVELVKRGIVSEADIENALQYQKEHPTRKIGDILYILDACDPTQLIQAIGDIVGEKGIIFFYGAEPLLNFDLIKKVVLYSKEKGYDIEYVMVSNGILLNAEIANFIKKNSISLGLSIDGPKNINDSNRIFKDQKKRL